MAKKIEPWQPTAALIGVIAGGISGYGAYTYAAGLKDASQYLQWGAALVGATAGIIPPMAKKAWKNEDHALSIGMWLMVIPLAAFMIFSASARVESGREIELAEKRAAYSKFTRIKELYETAKVKLEKAEAEESRAKGAVAKGRECGDYTACREAKEVVTKARSAFEEVEKSTFEAETKVNAIAQWQPPNWLLPLCLELVAFFSLWMAFARPWLKEEGKRFAAATMNVPSETKQAALLSFARFRRPAAEIPVSAQQGVS